MSVRAFDIADYAENRMLSRFSDTLRRVMRDLRRGRDPFARVRKAWHNAAPDLADRCDVVGFEEGGTLTVAVPSAPLRAELTGFRREELVERLHELPEGRDVVSIRFVLGGPER